MKLLCAWCGVSLEGSGYNQSLDTDTSHGICAACSEIFASDDGVSLQRYIDDIPISILLVDNSTGIVAANARACEMLGNGNRNAMIDQLIGPVFECAHSRLPQGCGRAIHCSGCTIRRSILTTFDTGEPQISIPATLTVASPDEPSEVVFTITTVKINELVVMRLEQVKRTAL